MKAPAISKAFSVMVFFAATFAANAQELYTARGFWEESNKANYVAIKKKVNLGDSLTTNEKLYLQDHETYLINYYNRMPDSEKTKYEQQRATWDREKSLGPVVRDEPDPFEPPRKNRLANGFYGFYYGLAIVGVGEIQNAAAAGIPLLTTGLWMMGPVIHPKKYEGASQNTVRMGNTGRLFGAVYGAALGPLLAGDSENTGKTSLALSAAGSLALGEIAFYAQKKHNYSAGYIDMMRHYSFLAAGTTLAVTASTQIEDPRLLSGTFLAGGVAGALIGNKVAKKYEYTRGDVDAISSMSLISTGVGFTIVLNSLNNSSDVNGLILIPAAGAVAGTLLMQKAVRGVHLSARQGSTLNLATGGSALIGLGIVALAQPDSPTVFIAVPTACALITHQILFHNFKMKNISGSLQGSTKKFNYTAHLKVNPENYFIGKKIGESGFVSNNPSILFQNPMATLTIGFRNKR